MKYLKYYLFLFFLLLVPNCYAQEINANQYISAEFNGTKNKYVGVSWENGQSSYYNIGTKYSGKLSGMTFYIHYPFEEGYTITITMNMADADWRNNFSTVYVYGCRAANDCDYVNYSNGTISFVSMYKIKFTFTPTENMADVRVSFLSKQGAMGNITGDTNWTLSSVLLNDPFYDSPSSGGGSSGGGSSGSTPTNQDIINNATGNTNKVIDNQNQNTQDILENNNQNTQSIIDSQNTSDINNVNSQRREYSSRCTNVIDTQLKLGKTLTTSGDLVDNPNSYYTEDYYYVYLKGNVNKLYINNPYNSKSGYFFIVYDQNKNFLSRTSTATRSVTLPSGAYWFRFSTPDPTTQISVNSGNCLTTADDTNNYLKDNSDPNIDNNEITSVFSNVGYSDPLNYLLQLPTMLINKLVSLSDSCQSINFGTLLGSPIIFPCINLENILGSSVWNTIDVICTVGLLVVIFKNLYQTFANLMTMGGEKEAREKFNMPTPMEFLSYILGGDR